VLSTTVRAPCALASLLSSARSITAQIGLAGVSAYNSFVLGLIAFLVSNNNNEPSHLDVPVSSWKGKGSYEVPVAFDVAILGQRDAGDLHAVGGQKVERFVRAYYY
jgi:hypothetical protein